MGRSTAAKRKRSPPASSNSRSRAQPSKGKAPAPSSTKTTVPIVIDYYDIEFRDDAHKQKYAKLFARGVIPTRFCDADTLKTLKIEEDVSWLFSNVGMGHFLTKKLPTFKRATLEFLSSLQANTISGKGCEHGLITFRLYNVEHSWNLATLSVIMGLPSHGSRHTPKEWNAGPLWSTLTHGVAPYVSKGSKASSLRHPAIRYVHRLLAGTILGRSDDSNVSQNDLYFLYHMLHAQPINTGAFLIKQMEHIANRKASKGPIVQGAFVTPIALHLQYKPRLEDEGMMSGSDALDYAACVSMHWFRKSKGTLLWKNKDGEEGDELPPQEEMTLRNVVNWSFRGFQPTVRAPSLPEPLVVPCHLEPPVIPSTTDGASSSSTPVERALEKLQSSVDAIKAEQSLLKENVSSIFTILANFNIWMQSQGFLNPSLRPP